MDVRLPNGMILANVPEGTTKDAIAAKAIKAGLATVQEMFPATDGMSGPAKFMAGMGKTVVDSGMALKQMGAGIGNAVGLVDDSTVTGLQQQEAERRGRDAALTNTGAGKAGELGGYVAQGLLMPVGGLAAGATKAGAARVGAAIARSPAVEAAIYGGIQGALMPTVAGESRLENVGLNGLLGGVVTKGLGMAGHALGAPGRMADDAMRGRSTSEYAGAVKQLEDAGVPLSTGQKTGTNWLKNAESTLADIPWGGKPLQTLREYQSRAYQKQLLKMAGLDDGADMVTGKTLESADKALGKKYAEAFQGVEINLTDDEFVSGLADIAAKHSQFLPFEQRAKINQIIDQVLDVGAKQENGAQLLSGKEYQRIRSHIGKLAKNTQNSDGYVSSLYSDLKALLDDSFEKVAGPDKFKVDKQYAALKQLRSIYDRQGGPAMSEGFISPVSVAKEAAKGPGSKEWKDFTRAAAAVLPDRMGNSGTAQRSMLLGLLGGGGLALDPASLIYGPLMARTFSKAAASGMQPNVAGLIPRVSLDPKYANPLISGSRGLSSGLLAQSQ